MQVKVRKTMVLRDVVRELQSDGKHRAVYVNNRPATIDRSEWLKPGDKVEIIPLLDNDPGLPF